MSEELYRTGSDLMPGVHLKRTADIVHVKFAQPYRVLSSAVLNGGYVHASDFLKLISTYQVSVERYGQLLIHPLGLL